MKAALIGVGQAGGKLTQGLVDYDRSLGFDAVQGAVAVNTAEADLQALDVDTLLVGQERVNGHGVGGDNELGAAIVADESTEIVDRVDDAISSRTEAVLVVAGLGGGTGSGGAPALVGELQRIYDLPIYVVGILPGRDEGAMYQANAGRSLKTVVREADSAILVDNDAFRAADESVEAGFDAINQAIAQRLGLLLASGEVVDGVAESVVDSSEIINTLREGGMAAVGYASAPASDDAEENISVVTSLTRRALGTSMSLPEARRAESALLVVAGQTDRIPRRGVERARKWLEEETDSMQVRGGDFPLDSDRLAALVVLSGVERSERVEAFVERAREATAEVGDVDHDAVLRTEELEDLF